MIAKPDYHTQEEFQLRSRKLEELQALGIDPYPALYSPTDTAEEILKKYESSPLGHSEEAAAGTTPKACIAGRLVLFRAMGKNAFAHLQDETGRLQVMFNRDQTEVVGYTPSENESEKVTPLKLIEKKIDLGDILGVEGFLFQTNKGEITLFAKKVTILCKTLLPLADKHAGLADKEIRYRKRWLDLITNEDVRQRFLQRSRILKFIRQYCGDAGFTEVETPILQSIYGGAEARPFNTRLHALNQEMFLRISLEIPLKKLVVGGLGKVFEIGKVFRNEGIDRNHNPEFSLLEAYAPYWDYQAMMSFMETLYEKLALELFGSTQIPATHPETGEPLLLELKAPWPRVTMKESLRTFASLDVDLLDDQGMRDLLLQSGHCDPKKVAAMSRGLLIAALFSVKVEHHLIQPHHIIDHPIETTPLCKLHRDPQERAKGIVERFESYILGQEASNAYTELNDPVIQRSLLEKQANRHDAGDEEASPLDEEFIEAICQGMPPTGGIGIGIDRLVMLFAHAHSIRDVLLFPWMKPLGSEQA